MGLITQCSVLFKRNRGLESDPHYDVQRNTFDVDSRTRMGCWNVRIIFRDFQPVICRKDGKTGLRSIPISPNALFHRFSKVTLNCWHSSLDEERHCRTNGLQLNEEPI